MIKVPECLDRPWKKNGLRNHGYIIFTDNPYDSGPTPAYFEIIRVPNLMENVGSNVGIAANRDDAIKQMRFFKEMKLFQFKTLYAVPMYALANGDSENRVYEYTKLVSEN